ncbi:MAG: insulinase family protein [Bacteroidales bacterium]|nr:insulinase family protein [Bacteroidales bacterium]
MTPIANFERHILSNGLRVLVHRDADSPFATVNTAYRVGSRDERPERTGFAHLFEHLMFEGTPEVPDFDRVVYAAGGEDNAFTSSDYTDYYITVPAAQTPTALRLEADRMRHLTLTEEVFDTERQVVIEEYRQRYLGQPYGDARLLLNPLAYVRHPYRWLPIGMSERHLTEAALADVRSFYDRFYVPDNAVIAVCGSVVPEEVFAWCETFFGSIPARHDVREPLTQEPRQTSCRTEEVVRDVPADALYMAFHTAGRKAPGFYACDMVSDALDAGKSTLLYRELIQKKRLFSNIGAAVTATVDPGLLLVQGVLAEGVSFGEARAGIRDCLNRLTDHCLSGREMEKLRNWHESTFIMNHIPLQQRAQSLCYHELFGRAEDLHAEIERYNAVTAEELLDTAREVCREDNCSILYYRASHNA